MSPSVLATLLIVVAGLLGGAGLVALRPALRGTTLLAAWWWAVLALLAVVAAELSIRLLELGWARVPLRFAAALLTFCPFIAVLGAKRPQHRAWSFVVVSLWLVLALPAAEVFFLQRGQELEVHDFRAWFLLAMVVVAAANRLPTRLWPGALLFAAAQLCLFGPYLPLIDRLWQQSAPVAAAMLLAASYLADALLLRREPAAPNSWWRGFRDRFGALWSLRVAERVNATAARSGWPVRLSWSGLRDESGCPLDTPPDQLDPTLVQSLHNLLRRFVSNEWLAEHLGTEQGVEGNGLTRGSAG